MQFLLNYFNIDRTPLLVVVQNRRYDLYGPQTPRSLFLKKMVDKAGGINESVEDGIYAFNITRTGLQKWAATLDKLI